VVVGYENFKYDVASLAGTLKGNGETIGGYVARRFGNLRFDAALGWSNVDYNATAGTAAGSFTGSRWLGSTGLTGDYKLDAYTIEPSAKVYVLWERQTAWTDSLGTAQDGRDFSARPRRLGLETRPFVFSIERVDADAGRGALRRLALPERRGIADRDRGGQHRCRMVRPGNGGTLGKSSQRLRGVARWRVRRLGRQLQNMDAPSAR
jgi:hypothetical protein